MKKFVPIIFILLSTLMIAAIPTEKEAAIYNDTVRLHILANSDSEEDQELKLYVRDLVLSEFSDELSDVEDARLARESLSALIPDIKECAENGVHEKGYSYSVDVTLGEEWFDTREYEDFTLPCGIYEALVIRIGNAEGKNWWCVMFPPLCLDIASENSDGKYSNEEIKLIKTSRYNMKFKILELIAEIQR